MASLKNSIINNMDATSALKRENMPADDKPAQMTLYKAYKEAVEAVREAASDTAQAAKRQDVEAVKNGTDAFYTAWKHLLVFLQDSPDATDCIGVSGTELEAVLPHVGTFRKNKETQEYHFTPTGEMSFRKALEKTIASKLLDRSMKSVAEIREERKAKAEAKKAANKAKREADKHAMIDGRQETLEPNMSEDNIKAEQAALQESLNFTNEQAATKRNKRNIA